MTVVGVEAEAATDYSLAYEIVTVGELLDDSAGLQLFNNLRVASVVVGVDEMFAVMPLEAP